VFAAHYNPVDAQADKRQRWFRWMFRNGFAGEYPAGDPSISALVVGSMYLTASFALPEVLGMLTLQQPRGGESGWARSPPVTCSAPASHKPDSDGNSQTVSALRGLTIRDAQSPGTMET